MNAARLTCACGCGAELPVRYNAKTGERIKHLQGHYNGARGPKHKGLCPPHPQLLAIRDEVAGAIGWTTTTLDGDVRPLTGRDMRIRMVVNQCITALLASPTLRAWARTLEEDQMGAVKRAKWKPLEWAMLASKYDVWTWDQILAKLPYSRAEIEQKMRDKGLDPARVGSQADNLLVRAYEGEPIGRDPAE